MQQISRRSFLCGLGLGVLGGASLPAAMAHADEASNGAQLKLHFIAPDPVWRSQDAIVVELVDGGGHSSYGLIDGGYGSTWATDDPRYVNRYKLGNSYNPSRLANCYHKTLDYLDELGICEGDVDFYIGTHPHSDHIGIAQELILKYRPKVVYTPEYKDEYLKPSTETFTNTYGMRVNGYNLFDNQYYYDRLVEATHEIGAPLVTTVEAGAGEPALDSDAAEPTFTLGGGGRHNLRSSTLTPSIATLRAIAA